MNVVTTRANAVVFSSDSASMVKGDTNGLRDVFERILSGHRTVRVSVTARGGQSNGSSRLAAASSDGHVVAYQSTASNLAGTDRNRTVDVFVRNLTTKTTRLVSIGAKGGSGNGASSRPAVSADGRYVAFESEASNLVTGDANGAADVFVRDLRKHVTRLVSVSTQGRHSNGESSDAAISGSGRFVAFASRATNLVSGGDNGVEEIFLRDRKAHTTRLISVATGGAPGKRGGSSEPAISGDGRKVAFQSSASNLVSGDRNGKLDIFVRNLRARTTSLVSSCCGHVSANGPSSHPAMSSDGRIVGFNTSATNLFRNDANHASDVVIRNLSSGKLRVESVSSAGRRGNGDSYDPSLSSDGRLVAFDSSASNLVPGDGNGTYDVFLRNVARGSTRLVSVPTSG